MTGKANVIMFTASKNSKSVRLQLVCTHPTDGSGDYVSATLMFDHRMSFSDRAGRFRFDDGEVAETTFGVSEGGQWFSISEEWREDGFFSALHAVKRLKVEINLPGRGAQIYEFDVQAAVQAIRQLPCSSK